MYHAQLGRFVSRDPIGYAGEATSLYAYVRNTPCCRVDPQGLQAAQPRPRQNPAPGVCLRKHRECFGDAFDNHEDCMFRGSGVCFVACGYACRKMDLPSNLVVGVGCWGLCMVPYQGACDGDLRIAQGCCDKAFDYCVANNGTWPGFWWRLIRGCPMRP